MSHTHAAAKSLRQSRRHRQRNLVVLQTVRKAIHDTRRAIQQKKATEAKALLLAATRALDRATAKGVITKNAAGRKKSRLTIALARLGKKE